MHKLGLYIGLGVTILTGCATVSVNPTPIVAAVRVGPAAPSTNSAPIVIASTNADPVLPVMVSFEATPNPYAASYRLYVIDTNYQITTYAPTYCNAQCVWSNVCPANAWKMCYAVGVTGTNYSLPSNVLTNTP